VDANTVERINQLAKNLKDLHLAASSEEAYERAKQIILGNAAPESEKSIKELMAEQGVTAKDLEKAKELLKEEEKALQELKEELTELKAKQLQGEMQHGEHAAEAEKLDKELTEDEYDLGVLEENVDAAEEVQEREKDKGG
jgi:antitoxin component HigA of HigAB toxin-antitoxin module